MEIRVVVSQPEVRKAKEKLKEFHSAGKRKTRNEIVGSLCVPIFFGELVLNDTFLLYLSQHGLARRLGQATSEATHISKEAVEVSSIALRLIPYNFFMMLLATIKEAVENFHSNGDLDFTRKMQRARNDQALLRSLLSRLGPRGLSFVRLVEAYDLCFDRQDRDFTMGKWKKVVDESLRVRRPPGRPRKKVYDCAYEMREADPSTAYTYGQIAQKLSPGISPTELASVSKKFQVAVSYRRRLKESPSRQKDDEQ